MSAKKTGFDTKQLRELADLLNETEMSEIEIEYDDLRVRMVRSAAQVSYTMPGPMPQAAQAAAPAAAAPAVAAAPAAAGGFKVPSPMVGTAYLSASPDAAPYVQVGSSISEGQTILIIEAMKTMNHIPSPRSGTVTAILVEDGQPVEFGEHLIMIE
jgi:acetyl-CoA carboxylase biotin carboxyl carrier protein